MPTREIYSRVLATQVLASQTLSSSTNSTAVDLQGYEAAMLIANLGTAGITLSGANKIGVQLQESDDNSTFTDVVAADTHNGESLVEFTVSANTPSAVVLSYKGTKRYIRGRVVFSGTHGAGTPIGMTMLRGNSAVAPVTQVN